uniref:Endonuclease/exonuclease/phosphatase domain-containing protein n=1 Tax=Trichogramma kaykai TaxID=54128 RepID=A0ABD2XNX3_9HYME
MDNSGLKILQWNARGIKCKTEAVKLFINYDTVVIFESFLNEHNHYTLQGFNAVRFDRACNSKGGILFSVKSNIMYDTLELGLNDLEQIEIAAITIDTYPEPTNIIAYYRSPTHKAGMSISSWRDEWHAVIDKVNNINQLFFLGDFNAHHPWWGSKKVCAYGQTMFDEIDVDKIALLNDGSAIHVSLTNGMYETSCIDLTFISINLLLDTQWRVLDDSWGSDHFPIEICYNVFIQTQIKIDYRYNLKKINWDFFNTQLAENKYIFNGLNYLNANAIDRYNIFISTLDTCIRNSLPTANNTGNQGNCTHNIKRTKKPNARCIWWNDECDKAIRVRRATLKSLKYQCSLDKFIEYKKIVATTRRTLKQVKKESFENFCESINKKTSLSKIWAKIKMFKNGFNRPISLSSNKLAQSNAETPFYRFVPQRTLRFCPIQTF